MCQELNLVISDDYSSDGAGLITYQYRQTAMSDGVQKGASSSSRRRAHRQSSLEV